MTLPAPKSPWPPEQWQPLMNMVAESAAWWRGDAKALDAHYGGKTRPSQLAGGVVGAASRFFWGSPAPVGQSVKKVHVPLAADLAATSASLLFETPPTFRVPDEGGNDIAQQRLDLMLNNEEVPADLLVAGESCAALGGVYARVMWDTDISDTPWIDWVDADSAIPEWSYGKLIAVTFVEELPKVDKDVWRLFSRYTAGRIEYGLYAGSVSDVGRVVPLTGHPATTALADTVDSDSGVDTHATGLCSWYFPNARPVVGFREDGQLRNMGRPDIAPDLHDLFDLLDETWTDLQREMRMAKARIVVPKNWLKTGGLGEGASFSYDREVYEGMNINDQNGDAKAEFIQPDIRVEKYLMIATAIVKEVLRRANYSPSTFGLDTEGGGSGMTAREIEDRHKISVQTWKAKSRYFRQGLSLLARDLVEVDAHLNQTEAVLTRLPQVDMPAPVQETMLDKGQTIQALESARSVSTETKVDILWPEWDDKRREVEVDRIKAEHGTSVVDPWLGMAPDENPEVFDNPDGGQ